MRSLLKMEALTVVAALSSVCFSSPLVERDAQITGTCTANYGKLGKDLSDCAELYFPGTDKFAAATLRWSSLENPTINVVVVPCSEEDVSITVSSPNHAMSPTRLVFLETGGTRETASPFSHVASI